MNFSKRKNRFSVFSVFAAALAIELVTLGNAAIVRAATLNAMAETEKTEKLLFLFEKFIECLVDNVFFVWIPVIQF